ncbi:hypothetical protein CTAYLR_003539 [Chrysophaeum taylorii]|uniref:Plant heme peroxidase family profile domain-containing protein n=1 Tax=Chrysophaeum taylorii TaxID=2483200 RepID=A0AAD7XHY1_9STRA|nr:hypothetical protein CTAYLR_003539 [Chrysophaeum taylorii]
MVVRSAIAAPYDEGPERVVDEMRAQIEALLATDVNCTLLPKFVRLVFHDCVGGCDGCVDMSDPENAGLLTPIEALMPICENIPEGSGVTRADCWAQAALSAAESSQDRSRFAFPLEKVGRQTCEAPNGVGGPERTMPNSHAGTSELIEWFREWFGFSKREIVALMGAHTLGGAIRNNSGYNGFWTPTWCSLNNDYYDSLWQIWSQKLTEEPNGHFQWELTSPPDAVYEHRTDSAGCPFLNLPGRGPPIPPDTDLEACPPLFMLNVDVAMAKDFGDKLNSHSGQVDCLWVDQPDDYDPREPCADARLLDFVLAYRDDNRLWVRDFQQVLTKLINTKARPLTKLDTTDSQMYDGFF